MEGSPTLNRHYWRERAAEILPSATPREIVRAAQILKLQYSAPEAVYEVRGSSLPEWRAATVDATAFDGRTGGGVPDMPLTPDAWSARQHDLTLKAGKYHGRRGKARVQGGTCPTVLREDVPAFLTQVLEDMPRTRVGASSFDILQVCDAFYGERLGVPRMIGTDAIAPAQMVRVADGVDPRSARFEYGVQDAVYTPQTWPTRYRLPRVIARKSEPVTPTHLIAPADRPDRVFIGHKCVKRGVLARKARGGKRAARTIGTVILDNLSAAPAALSSLNRGERVILDVNGVKVTVSRGKGTTGAYSLTVPGAKRSDGHRTADGAARALVKAIA